MLASWDGARLDSLDVLTRDVENQDVRRTLLGSMLHDRNPGGRFKALEALKTMNGIETYQDSFASAYALAAAGGRYALERSKWEEAARFDLAAVPDFPWEKYPHFESIAWFTRGVGAARSGDRKAAEEAERQLDDHLSQPTNFRMNAKFRHLKTPFANYASI